MSETRQDAMTKDDIEVANHWTDAGGDWAGLTPRQQDDARNFARRIRATPPAAETGERVIDWENAKAHATDVVESNNRHGFYEFEAQNLARAYLAVAAPAPREVSEAMVEACIQYELSTYSRPKFAPIVLEQAREFYRGVLRAALSAETGTP